MPDGEPGVPEDGVGADRLIFDYDPCIKIPAPGMRLLHMYTPRFWQYLSDGGMYYPTSSIISWRGKT